MAEVEAIYADPKDAFLLVDPAGKPKLIPLPDGAGVALFSSRAAVEAFAKDRPGETHVASVTLIDIQRISALCRVLIDPQRVEGGWEFGELQGLIPLRKAGDA